MGELTAISEVANSATNRLRVNYAMRVKIRSVIRGVLPYSAVSLIADYFDVWLTTLSLFDD